MRTSAILLLGVLLALPCFEASTRSRLSVSVRSGGGIQARGASFCYEIPDCDPNSDAWDKLCHTGQKQSPINIIPSVAVPLRTTIKAIYKGDVFRMINNGHSVQIDFDGKGPTSSEEVTLPDPLKLRGLDRGYKFASAHLHWGVNDYSTGSEHCIFGKCSAMELHLVHYLAKYATQGEAVQQGGEDALAVIGILIDVSDLQTVGNSLVNTISKRSPTNGTGPLSPIVNNLHKVATADHSGKEFVTVEEPLDLGALLKEQTHIYTYKGSLTTPGCNEQVNWYVMARPSKTSHQNLEAFRSILKDDQGKVLAQNHRPLQQTNGRRVMLSAINVE